MKIIETLAQSSPAFSFEFLPPKGEAGMTQLFDTVAKLAPYEPAYVSVTWGAGGSTRRLTIDLVQRIQRETGIESMAHLTCVGATAADIADVLTQIQSAGIRNVLALRGDPPRGVERFEQVEGGFAHAEELVRFVRSRGDFCVAGACYPETHPEAVSADADLDHLAAKVRAGVDFLVTQLFFDPADYFRFVERARARGIACPIVPGVWPITNLSQIQRITALCGARIPAPLLARLQAAPDIDGVRQVGIEHAIAQCRELLAGGAPGIHFYTLNHSPATKQILEAVR